MVAHGTPCLGPVTHAGCGAICPAYNRGCYGCYGPKETPNTGSLSAWMSGKLGVSEQGLLRAFRGFNAYADAISKRERGTRRLMKTRTIKVDYLARVEGEGALLVKIKDGR